MILKVIAIVLIITVGLFSLACLKISSRASREEEKERGYYD